MEQKVELVEIGTITSPAKDRYTILARQSRLDVFKKLEQVSHKGVVLVKETEGDYGDQLLGSAGGSIHRNLKDKIVLELKKHLRM